MRQAHGAYDRNLYGLSILIGESTFHQYGDERVPEARRRADIEHRCQEEGRRVFVDRIRVASFTCLRSSGMAMRNDMGVPCMVDMFEGLQRCGPEADDACHR